MAIELDGFAVLRAVADHESLFSELKAEIVKFAKTLLLQQLKAKTTELARLREIYHAVGPEALLHVFDDLPDAQLKSVLARLDPKRAEVKQADGEWLRGHLRALAEGAVEPAQTAKRASGKTAKKPAEEKKPAEAPPQRLAFRSAGAKRKR